MKRPCHTYCQSCFVIARHVARIIVISVLWKDRFTRIVILPASRQLHVTRIVMIPVSHQGHVPRAFFFFYSYAMARPRHTYCCDSRVFVWPLRAYFICVSEQGLVMRIAIVPVIANLHHTCVIGRSRHTQN